INGVHLLSGQRQSQTCPGIGSPSWPNNWITDSFIDINFQNEKSESIAQNIRFKDGSVYGAGGVPQVYHLEGNIENPILRITIKKDGTVSYEGSNESYGPLFPLDIIADLIEYEIPTC